MFRSPSPRLVDFATQKSIEFSTLSPLSSLLSRFVFFVFLLFPFYFLSFFFWTSFRFCSLWFCFFAGRTPRVVRAVAKFCNFVSYRSPYRISRVNYRPFSSQLSFANDHHLPSQLWKALWRSFLFPIYLLPGFFKQVPGFWEAEEEERILGIRKEGRGKWILGIRRKGTGEWILRIRREGTREWILRILREGRGGEGERILGILWTRAINTILQDWPGPFWRCPPFRSSTDRRIATGEWWAARSISLLISQLFSATLTTAQ